MFISSKFVSSTVGSLAFFASCVALATPPTPTDTPATLAADKQVLTSFLTSISTLAKDSLNPGSSAVYFGDSVQLSDLAVIVAKQRLAMVKMGAAYNPPKVPFQSAWATDCFNKSGCQTNISGLAALDSISSSCAEAADIRTPSAIPSLDAKLSSFAQLCYVNVANKCFGNQN